MKTSTILTVSLIFAASALWAADSSQVSYPKGYRDWHHVKSMVINKGHPLFASVGGFHDIYANPKAVKGYKAGKFPDGSVIVFDLFEAKDANNAISEGARKAVIVMQHDSKRFTDTDGWGYQVFDPATEKGKLDAKAAKDCHACHISQKDKDFVFSKLGD
jgi:cytochrome P460